MGSDRVYAVSFHAPTNLNKFLGVDKIVCPF